MKLLKNLLLSLFLVACNASATSDAQSDGVTSATNSPQPPTATLEPTQTATLAPTLTPTAFIPTLDLEGINTVEPSDLAITSNNFQRIEILAELSKGRLNDAAISPDGTIIAAATSRGVYLYDADSLKEFAFLNAGSTRLVEFAPGGSFLAADLQIWDLDRLESVHYLSGHIARGRYIAMAISPDGNYLAMTAQASGPGDPDDTLQVWDLRTGGTIFALQEYDGFNTDISFSPDSSTLAVSGSNSRSTLFDVKSGEIVVAFKEQSGSVAFSPDGEKLLFSNGQLWDIATEQYTQDFGEGRLNLQFSPDGKRVVFWPGIVEVWDVSSGERVYTIENDGWIRDVSISDDGQRIITLTQDNVLFVWDFNSGQLLDIIDEFNSGLRALEFEKNGRGLAVGDNDGAVFLWDVETSLIAQTYASNSERVIDLVFSSNDQLLAAIGFGSGNISGDFVLWDKKNALQILSAKDVCSITANQDVLAISYRNRIEIFNLHTGLVEKVFPAICLNNLVISADGNTMVGSKDSSVVAYNVASGQEKWRDDSNVEVGSSFAFSIEDLALSFDDQYLSAAVTNGIVYIWDAALGDLVHSLEAHQPFANDGPPSGAMAVAFSPKSLLLVSAGGDDGTLAFWDPLSGELFGRLGPISVNGYLFPTWSPDNIYFADLRALINDIGAMRFSPDGRYLSVGGRYSGSLYLLGLPQ